MHIEIGCAQSAYGSRRFDSPEYHIIACSQGTWGEGEGKKDYSRTHALPLTAFIRKEHGSVQTMNISPPKRVIFSLVPK